jgi:hypothetical protein
MSCACCLNNKVKYRNNVGCDIVNKCMLTWYKLSFLIGQYELEVKYFKIAK